MPVQPINVGEKIRASWLNEIVEAVNAGATPGRSGENSVLAALGLVLTALDPKLFVPVRIMVTRLGHEPLQTFNNELPPRPINTAYTPSTISYDVKALRSGWLVEDIAPTFGRDVRNDEALIYPAHTGLVAFMIRAVKMREAPGQQLGEYTADLMLLPGSEVVARRRCPTGGGAVSGPFGRFQLPPPQDLPVPVEVDSFSTPVTGSQSSQASDGSGVDGGTPGGGTVG